jgi:hypothetical protein
LPWGILLCSLYGLVSERVRIEGYYTAKSTNRKA